jgi:hypothetical protein
MIAAGVLLATSGAFAWWAIKGVRRGRIHAEGFTSERSARPGVFWSSVGFYAAMSIIGLIAGIAAALHTIR